MTSKFKFFKYGFAFFALSAFLLPVSLEAQDSEFQTANRMIQQQNYEEAVVILQRLHEENPDANIFPDRLLDGLVYLEDYEDAVRYIDRQIQRGDNTDHLLIRKAEIVHMKGDREAATDLLRSVVEKNQNNMQIYFQAGNALLNRREYRLAAELYLEARSNFGDSTLFINEIANAHMQSGNFEEAVSEYFRLVRENPGQINFVQQRLMRMQDKDLFETAAMEFEDHLTDLDTSHEAYHELHQLYTWLLIETGQFQRAFSAARQYESRTESTRYSLYSLAEPLAENNEYKLAADAYRYYSESADRVLRYRSIDNQSRIYRLWADYLENHNLDDLQKREELYRKSYQTAAGLLNEAPEYEQRGRVMVRLAEISLDIFYDSEKASRWIDLLTEQNNGEPHANLLYLQGRLHLFNRSYSEARQAFTRANREAGEALPAEKSRYFLSLTDFFSGDFEFALLQLGELERRNGSYFANDGLKLRMWIQKGTRA
ncbi:MAG: tetratricopeptide repeat protein, partial [Balneolaceae bacterium]